MPGKRDPVIVSFARTPQGKFGGALAEVNAPELGAIAIRAAIARAGIAPEMVGEVVMGIVLSAGLGQHPARQAALSGGIPDAVPAYNINKMCGSGMKALMNAANSIRAGEHDIVIAGGMESMSRTPFLIGRQKWKPDSSTEPVDHLFHDGLCDPYHDIAMGCTGDHVAAAHGVSRADSDAFALESHRRATHAIDAGWYADEITPVATLQGDVTRDEGFRPDASAETLAALKPVFGDGGVVTAGNASQISDGGAALVVMARETAAEHDIAPLATITAQTATGLAPMEVMWAPVPTVQQLWAQYGRSEVDYDLYEHNEAFASASVAVMRGLGLLHAKLNPCGGAVALG
ncbi:MAG: thiolase family protein, partial [Candidatus Thermoplasmatota archaeon]|nr:thiolase family protein [Candidatus Thermoplasmatota archaeon]